MSGINRWADSSDDDDDINETVAILQEEPIFTPIQVGDGAFILWYVTWNNFNTCLIQQQQMMEPIKPLEVASVPSGRFHIEDDDDDDKEREDEPNDDSEESQRRLEEAKEKAKAKAELKKQHSSVSVKDQLDNLDDILSELGIEQPVPIEDDANDDVQTGDDAKKRRKKKKKGSAVAKDEDSPSTKDEEISPSPTDTVPVDVSAICKSKTKKKAPSAASEAAASAAKELKAKQEGKKKKKRGDNVQFGRWATLSRITNFTADRCDQPFGHSFSTRTVMT